MPVSELTALLLGLLTPLAACGILAAMIDAWAVNVSPAAVWSRREPCGR